MKQKLTLLLTILNQPIVAALIAATMICLAIKCNHARYVWSSDGFAILDTHTGHASNFADVPKIFEK